MTSIPEVCEGESDMEEEWGPASLGASMMNTEPPNPEASPNIQKPPNPVMDPLEGSSTSHSMQAPESGLRALPCPEYPGHPGQPITEEGTPDRYQ